ncbi:alpha/beta hydrolase [Croceicoccus ponticola]|uniref:Alpha/beta hydrolase n=1 Tax=Croceicoccus ponticola TaxID=2217664 RepID=A0A437H1R9_9SPHN|nr:alpha/beta fold hydrolase [Croceicoccus ponticola]RVQ69597.1 alpha/beta hydrolase [Croceicoccus ponticola]
MEVQTHSPRFFGLGPLNLPAVLRMPDEPRGLIVFAHGSGSGHRSPRNNQVAEALTESGFATLLFDLLTVPEERDRSNVFDIQLLATRLIDAVVRLGAKPELSGLPIGLFGASTGAGAALLAAAVRPDLIDAVVSRGGRPDLAGPDALQKVRAPTQLIVGSVDYQVIELNRAAANMMNCPHEIVIIPGAGHLFEEPGALAQVIQAATRWFSDHLGASKGAKT